VDIGLFGKLPSHGDFLRRRVSDAFVDAWDAWLRECLAESRVALGERWIDLYLTSPAWRFVCEAGACGAAPLVGLMVPSVDRVGRFFPLTLVAELPEDVNLMAAASGSSSFFENAERLLIETLATEEIDFERFDGQVVQLGATLEALTIPPPVLLDPAAAVSAPEGAQAWHISLGGGAQLTPIFEQLLAHHLSLLYRPLVLWWTEGSAEVEPSCLMAKGLPHPGSFGALLDGSWTQYGWRSVAGRVDTAATVEMRVEDAMTVVFRSAAASDVGLIRKVNEDAFIERPEVGIWAVADGLGGHRAGEIASHMVCDALAELAPHPTFEGTIDAVRQRLQLVNEHLLRTASRPLLTDRSASTVVVLMVRGRHCAILWAGDSRVYRWRSGRLERLTHDHSAANLEALEGAALTNVVTRAVGVQSNLALELLRDTASAGDRFLLCSDGLTRLLTDAQIEVWMASSPIRAAVDGLISDTLAAGAPDNVTALIVESYGEAL
jgi:type VI secretion system protein ImpM